MYYNLGPDKRLNEIVVAGSHDAGITGGAQNVQTQDLNILDQAIAGVRVFDIRLKSVGKGNQAQIRTYHGKTKDPAKQSRQGAYGESLTKVLADARSFVTNPLYTNEFIILKFDKCSGWPSIAAACVRLLGGTRPNGVLYEGTGNLNRKKLRKLAGSVVVLFTTEGYDEVKLQYPPGSGILCVRAIADAPYDAINFHGMQYCGKGGTDWDSNGSKAEKMDENYTKQRDLMAEGASGDPDVMGMMYWTTTGFLASIRDRNDAMWNGGKPGQVPTGLKVLFKGGIKKALEARIPRNIDPTNYNAGAVLKVFMPNIVMIDFANPDACRKIFDLNRVAGTQIVKAFQEVDAEVQRLQANHGPNLGHRQRGGRPNRGAVTPGGIFG